MKNLIYKTKIIKDTPMKKITLVLAFIGMIGLTSCVREEVVVQDTYDQDTISEVWEYTNVDFYPNNYSLFLDFPHTIYSSDMVLVYRLAGGSSAGDIWKLLPETYYFDDGTLDFGYNNDFTQYDVKINLYGYDLAGLSNAYKLDQIFRVVVIPAAFGKSANKVDVNDYQAVIQAYGIDESKIQKIKM
ncbi:hypothetical protein FSS13T_26180 [Flavobacterium saliperosum S13]|uniref:Uncharacterized protein n=3 Tax=Flavobacterium saliperosum TaxID=329186 RepID=A0A1G4WA44_9FLAO|nr:hypothetical protein FSS13T_26180 [Flavobacterium saliperosum S13]SCX18570.1 hypothetical protein SAMN02927925_02701 [Flavobacterium saliperosum]